MSRFTDDSVVDEGNNSNHIISDNDGLGSQSRDQTLREWYDEDINIDERMQPPFPGVSSHLASSDSKYEIYAVSVNRSNGDKASKIALFSN